MLNIQVGLYYKFDHDQVLFGLSYVFLFVFTSTTSRFFYIQSIYLLLIKYSLCSSLDPLFHSDSIIDRDRCKGNECISIL